MVIVINTLEEFRSGRKAGVVRALEMARRSAKALAGGRVPSVAPDVLSRMLAQQLLPQVESDVRLASGIPGGEGQALISELTEQRQGLGRAVEGLDRALLEGDVHGVRTQGSRRRMVRTLEAVAQVLDRHLATEGRLWEALTARCSDDGISALVGEAEAAERRAAGSLRFVWHPPVPETDAKALWWTSPKTRRVFVVDSARAAALGGEDGVGTVPRREP